MGKSESFFMRAAYGAPRRRAGARCPAAGSAGVFVQQWRLLTRPPPMDILFVADPLEAFKIYKDTTFSMMREAQRRGHRVAACEPSDITWRSGDVVRAPVREIELTGDPHDWFR